MPRLLNELGTLSNDRKLTPKRHRLSLDCATAMGGRQDIGGGARECRILSAVGCAISFRAVSVMCVWWVGRCLRFFACSYGWASDWTSLGSAQASDLPPVAGVSRNPERLNTRRLKYLNLGAECAQPSWFGAFAAVSEVAEGLQYAGGLRDG